MNILIFGSNGMLGTYINSYLSQHYKVFGLTRKDIDIYKSFQNSLLYNDLLSFLTKFNPECVINCIGNISKKPSTQHPNEYYVINSYFPIILSRLCNDMNIHMIHATTDCVFSGFLEPDCQYKDIYKNINGYSEFSNSALSFPKPIDDYGLSKFLGENIDATVIRVSIIGEEKENSRSLLNWIISNKGQIVSGYTNHYWNGITCLQYAKLVYDIIQNKKYWTGVKHFYSTYKNQNYISKYELVKIISEIYDLNITVIPRDTEIQCNRTLKGENIDNDLYKQIIELKEYSI
jgi:dTDP-4-dehydrorhamnose reductase